MSGLDNTQYESTNLRGEYAWTDNLKGIHYGPGSVKTALPKLLKTLGASKALVVTGRSLHDKVSIRTPQPRIHSHQPSADPESAQTDVVQRVESVLKEHGAYAATFHEIGQHAPVAGIHNGLRVFKESGADVIVSVGGGSPVDASKAILYFHQKETGGAFLSQIAIPTTLSAAEYTVSERSRALVGVFRSCVDRAVGWCRLHE